MLVFMIPAEAGSKIAASIAETFAGLYEQYVTKVFRFVRYRIEDDDTAQDITSVVFEKALTRFQTYKSDRASFSTWIFSIARNTVIDHLRVSHSDMTTELDPELPIAAPGSPEEDAIRSDERQRLHAHVLRLSEPEQKIIALKFGAEMKNREIARMTGLSDSKVANIVFRAVRKLRESYGGQNE